MTTPNEAFTVLTTCGRGIVPFLKEEITALQLPILRELESGIELKCTMPDIMRLNLFLRTANRVLLELSKGRARDANELYSHIHNLPWETLIPDTGYFTVASYVDTPAIRDSRFANVKCKDAIVDRFREKFGHRPDSGNERSGAVVFLHWVNDVATVYLDTSGESLSRRGYRKIPMEAPMQEALAAAVVMATGWKGPGLPATMPATAGFGLGHFINPMCGSGTLAIEAALQAQGRAPGLLRSQFGFLHLKDADTTLWQQIRSETRALPKHKLTGRIIASDNRPEAIEAARQNARTAGVEQLIEFHVCDFADTPIPPADSCRPGLCPGAPATQSQPTQEKTGTSDVIVLNPAYGERMGDVLALEPVYRRIGDFFKQKCQGYRGYVFTGNLDLGKMTGLRSNRKILFFNGNIECRLLGFNLYAGSVRKSKQPQSEGSGNPDNSQKTL
jgi:23S rRNA G2445 N2-methylase RlmL